MTFKVTGRRHVVIGALRVKTVFNLYHSMDKFSRRQLNPFFSYLPLKQDLTFHANCLLFIKISKSLFGKKNKKNQNVVADILSMLSVKQRKRDIFEVKFR